MIPLWGGALLALGGAAVAVIAMRMRGRRSSEYAQGHRDGIAAGLRAAKAVRL